MLKKNSQFSIETRNNIKNPFYDIVRIGVYIVNVCMIAVIICATTTCAGGGVVVCSQCLLMGRGQCGEPELCPTS